MATDAEGHVLPAQRGDFGVAQAGLNRELEQNPVPPTDPSPGIRHCHQRSGLPLIQEGHGIMFVAFGRDSEDLLALEGQGWFRHGYEPKKRA
jgi:hypothetical protein